MEHVIYRFIFPNGKSYVGQTKNFASRISNHKKSASRLLLKTPLYNAIRKHGWNNLVIEKLILCSPEDVDDLERLYIQKYDTLNKDFGYNLDSGGVLNKKHSSDTRHKISITNKNKSVFTFRTQAKKISCYSSSGIYVGTYESASEAARQYKVAANTIARAANGGRRTSCGLVWRWEENLV